MNGNVSLQSRRRRSRADMLSTLVKQQQKAVDTANSNADTAIKQQQNNSNKTPNNGK
jgi:hypothetical protein